MKLTPRSSVDRVDGTTTTADGISLKARVRAVPEGGAANAALGRLIADWLGIACSQVSLARGGKSRGKSLMIRGDPNWLDAQLESKLEMHAT